MSPPGPASPSRLSQVLLALALGGAAIGFVHEVRRPPSARPTSMPQITWRATLSDHGTGATRPAPSYRDLLIAQHGAELPRHEAAFAAMHAQRPGVLDEVARDPAALEAARAARAQTRAFAGAPPVIPHPIDQRGYPSCVTCHADGMRIGNRVAPMMSHEALSNCTQCHATSQASPPTPAHAVTEFPSDFEGVQENAGARAHAGAPPQMPHSTFMRERCESCHGVLAQGIRTTHPYRQSCLQCHAPVSERGSAGPPASHAALAPGATP